MITSRLNGAGHLVISDRTKAFPPWFSVFSPLVRIAKRLSSSYALSRWPPLSRHPPSPGPRPGGGVAIFIVTGKRKIVHKETDGDISGLKMDESHSQTSAQCGLHFSCGQTLIQKNDGTQ